MKSVNDCTFCHIQADSNKHVVFEDKTCLVFLDIRPVFLGHCLLIPKDHYETIYDLPSELLKPLFSDLQLVGKGVQDGLNSQGTFIGMNNTVSQSVPHLHIHIIPRNKGDGLRGFFWPRMHYTDEQEMEKYQQLITEAISLNQNTHEH